VSRERVLYIRFTMLVNGIAAATAAAPLAMGGRDLYHSAAPEELSDPEREMISPTSSTRHASSRSGR
jgi:hypothetical protein